MASAFFSSSSIEPSNVHNPSSDLKPRCRSLDSLYLEYELEETIQIILKNDYKNIALQFPDELLSDSIQVSTELTKKTKRNFFVLADTTFGSCCVDEIAASHAHADFLVHYGRACLTPHSRLAVHYVFTKKSFDFEKLYSKISETFKKNEDLILMWDVEYDHIIAKVKNHFESMGFTRILWSRIVKSKNPSPRPTFAHSRTLDIPSDTPLSEYKIIYIGVESLTLTNILLTHSSIPLYLFNTQTCQIQEQNASVNKLLSRRYYMVQRAKDADSIGIVVGTLGVESYLDVIKKLKALVAKAGKKFHVLAMGKPSPEKLGNYLDISVFCLVACPENSLLDSREFHVPVVTPFELLLALGQGMEWDGSYECNLNILSEKLQGVLDICRDESVSRDDVPYFSLVTGGYKQMHVQEEEMQDVGINEQDNSQETESSLISKLDAGSLQRFTEKGTAMNYFKKREFKGLEVKRGETPVEVVVQGRSGIASDYGYAEE